MALEGRSAILVVDAEGGELYRMENWPVGVGLAQLPEPGSYKGSSGPPRKPKEGRDPPLPVREPRFSTVEMDGVEWRVVVSGNERETLFIARDLSVFAAGLRSERRGIFLIVPGSLLLSALASWWLAGRALRPVARLSEKLEGIEPSDLGERLDGSGEARERIGSFVGWWMFSIG